MQLGSYLVKKLQNLKQLIWKYLRCVRGEKKQRTNQQIIMKKIKMMHLIERKKSETVKDDSKTWQAEDRTQPVGVLLKKQIQESGVAGGGGLWSEDGGGRSGRNRGRGGAAAEHHFGEGTLCSAPCLLILGVCRG